MDELDRTAEQARRTMVDDADDGELMSGDSWIVALIDTLLYAIVLALMVVAIVVTFGCGGSDSYDIVVEERAVPEKRTSIIVQPAPTKHKPEIREIGNANSSKQAPVQT